MVRPIANNDAVSTADYEVIIPRAVASLVAQLRGQRAGYGAAYAELARDPCSETLGAYRLSGPLEPSVCGVHLRNGWRLAFTMQPADRGGTLPRVVILFVGKREPRHRGSDAWAILHDLFGVENPPEDHHKPPCCEAALPALADDVLDAFLRQVHLLTRGRR
jgi:hypothetical protein